METGKSTIGGWQIKFMVKVCALCLRWILPVAFSYMAEALKGAEEGNFVSSAELSTEHLQLIINNKSLSGYLGMVNRTQQNSAYNA